MTERAIYDVFVLAWTLVTPAIFYGTTRVVAPYGRHARPGWGPTLPARPAWVITELPAVALFAALFFAGDRTTDAAALAFLAIWQVHYVHRTLVFPFLLRPSDKRTPASIVGFGFVFNGINAYVNARWLFTLGPRRGAEWLADPRFIVGLLVFAAGMAINLHADAVLRRLRAPGETGYKIPRGGAYRWVSCPNYLGEILEWTGWAIATWSTAGLSFALWTVANLAPRARTNHAWYRERFKDYPPERRALVPGLW
jgi:protein-S-isoprenylcysteine O-methyltransferase Ste14